MPHNQGCLKLKMWLASLRDYEPSLENLLDHFELERAARFRLLDDRRRFVIGVVLSRLVIGELIGILPSQVVIDRKCYQCGQPHGKPKTRDVEFSVSHSGPYVMVGVAPFPIGIDIEEITTHEESAQLFDIVLTDGERQWISSKPADLRAHDFTTLWVRKEAVLKATGIGLMHSMTEVEVLSSPNRHMTCLVAGDQLVIQDLPPIGEYVAAVAAITAEVPVLQMSSGSELLLSWKLIYEGRLVGR